MDIAVQPSAYDQTETVPVNSSWISYLKYDQTNLRLEIGFRDGRIVQHWPVYLQSFLDFKLSPSKGRYYSQAIRSMTPALPIKG
jgi:hypothetical protein